MELPASLSFHELAVVGDRVELVDVRAGEKGYPYVETLYNQDVCPFPLNDCSDHGYITDFFVDNQRAD